MTDSAIGGREERPRTELAALRRGRLLRALAEMERDGLDAVILGREANVRYVSGAHRLWAVGVRAFGPHCVVVRRDAAVYLLSTWDDGVPPEIPIERLYPMRWNPESLVASLRPIPGLSDARRIGVDGLTPAWMTRLSSALPRAQWVNGTGAICRARRRKTNEEVSCLRTAAALARRAFDAMSSEVRAGARERFLVGRFTEEAARLGATIPAFEPSFCAAPREPGPDGPLPRRVSAERSLEAGELVFCHAGVLYERYEGAVGGTVICAEAPEPSVAGLRERSERLLAELQARCRPGMRLEDVAGAYEACGESRPDAARFPILHGVGLGIEPPILGFPAASQALLEDGMVIAVHAYAAEKDAGAWFARRTLHIVEGGCEILDRGAKAASRSVDAATGGPIKDRSRTRGDRR